MARIRSIKPTMPHDRKLAGLSRDARLTFIYLISQADDQGLVLGEPRQLLGALYPHDNDVTERKLLRWIAELSDTGMVAWHRTRDGMRVLRVVGWQKHQQVKNPGKPVLLGLLADPPGQDDLQPSPDSTDDEVESSGDSTETLPRSSGDSTEDHPTLSVGSGGAEEGKKGVREEGSKGGGKKGGRAPAGASTPRADDRDPPSWPARLHQAWGEAVGFVEVGRIGRVFKPIIAKHGEDLVTRAIRHYGRTKLDDGELKFASPEDFARTAVQWLDYARPVGTGTLGVVR